MPEPVFRQTSGKLPAGFEKRVFDREASAESDPSQPAATPAADIQPQPDVSEEFTHDELFAELQPQSTKRSGAGVVLAVLGILVMLALAVLILATIYFLFFYQTNGINNLN